MMILLARSLNDKCPTLWIYIHCPYVQFSFPSFFSTFREEQNSKRGRERRTQDHVPRRFARLDHSNLLLLNLSLLWSWWPGHYWTIIKPNDVIIKIFHELSCKNECIQRIQNDLSSGQILSNVGGLTGQLLEKSQHFCPFQFRLFVVEWTVIHGRYVAIGRREGREDEQMSQMCDNIP